MPANFTQQAVCDPPMVMPWGKHKGRPLGEVDRSYLRWVLEKADHATQDLREAIALELGVSVPDPNAPNAPAPAWVEKDVAAKWKDRHTAAVKELAEVRAELALARKDRPDDHEAFRRLLKQTYASLSRKYHPDAGGDARAQQIVNEFYRDLVARLQAGGRP